MTEGPSLEFQISEVSQRRRSQLSGSRITRLYSFHEVALEYSLVVIVMACFFLVSFSSRLLKQNNGNGLLTLCE